MWFEEVIYEWDLPSLPDHEEVDYHNKGECGKGCLKVAQEQLPGTESHEEEYENEEQDYRQFFK